MAQWKKVKFSGKVYSRWHTIRFHILERYYSVSGWLVAAYKDIRYEFKAFIQKKKG